MVTEVVTGLAAVPLYAVLPTPAQPVNDTTKLETPLKLLLAIVTNTVLAPVAGAANLHTVQSVE
jgi:hypothetical protein